MKAYSYFLFIIALMLNSVGLAQTNFDVIATGANLRGNTLVINNVTLKNKPNAVVLITRKADENYNPLTSDHAYGVFYQGEWWYIIDYSGNDIPLDAEFSVVATDESSSSFFIHETSAQNTENSTTTISSPFLDGREDLVLLVTQHYGQFNNTVVRTAFYDNQWHIENIDGNDIPLQTKFNILVCAPGESRDNQLYLNATRTAMNPALTWDFISRSSTGNSGENYHFITKNNENGTEQINIVNTSKHAPRTVNAASTGISNTRQAMPVEPSASRSGGTRRAKPVNEPESQNEGRTSNGNTVRINPNNPGRQVSNERLMKSGRLSTHILKAAVEEQIGNRLSIILDDEESFITIGNEQTHFTIPEMKVKKAGRDWTYYVRDIRSTDVVTDFSTQVSGVDKTEYPNRIVLTAKFETDGREFKGYCEGCIKMSRDNRAPDVHWRNPEMVIILKPVAIQGKLSVVVEDVFHRGEFYSVSAFDFLAAHLLHLMEEKMEDELQSQLQLHFTRGQVQDLLINALGDAVQVNGITNIQKIDISTQGNILIQGFSSN